MKLLRAAVTTAIMVLACSAVGVCALHPGDRISIDVYNHPELNTQATIDSLGRISMPLIGSVAAAGADQAELKARIKARLAQYVQYPAVDVTLEQQSSNIFVDGGAGGVLPYTPGITLSTALADLSKQCTCDFQQGPSNLSDITVQRDGKMYGPFDGRDSFVAFALQPADHIVLPNNPIGVVVQGQVKHPGMAYLSENQPLSEAVTQVGGATTDAAYAILLKRHGQLTQLGTSSPAYSQPAQPGDELIVPNEEHVQVLGAVQGTAAGTGGVVTLKQDFTLLSAVYGAGGPNHWANLHNVEVIYQGVRNHYDLTKMVHGDLSVNPALPDGATVYVPEGHKVDWSKLWGFLTFGRLFLPAPIIK